MRRLHSCTTITELRKRVIALVRATDDVQLLREMDRMLKQASKNIAVYITSPYERAAIAKGMEAFRNGRVHSAAEADKAILKWFAKPAAKIKRRELPKRGS